jgi:hypothetical protein
MEKAKFEVGRSSNNLGTFKNPHNICTWNENSACASCGIKGQLACKWDKIFSAVFTPSLFRQRLWPVSALSTAILSPARGGC